MSDFVLNDSDTDVDSDEEVSFENFITPQIYYFIYTFMTAASHTFLPAKVFP